MTVVFLTPVGSLGGAERSLVDLAVVLRELRPELRLHVISGADGPLGKELERNGVDFEVVKMPPSLQQLGESRLQWSQASRYFRKGQLALRGARALVDIPKYYADLRTSIVRLRPSVVHSNGMKCHVFSGYVSPFSVPVVWHIRDFVGTRPLLGTWLPTLARPPSAIITNSRAVKSDVERLFPTVPAYAIYNGIDTDFFAPGPVRSQMLDELSGLSPATCEITRVGLIATYARWKGQDVFIDSAARLIKAGKHSIRFYIIGGPAYFTQGSQFSEAELKAKIQKTGCTEQIGLIPFQNDLRNVYRGLDIVVHASTHPEPFGRTIVEGMSCGRAVVVTLGGGATELFTDGYDAIGVAAGNVNDLSHAIAELCDNPMRRAVLGHNARASTTARFERKQMGKSVLSVYDSFLSR